MATITISKPHTNEAKYVYVEVDYEAGRSHWRDPS